MRQMKKVILVLKYWKQDKHWASTFIVSLLGYFCSLMLYLATDTVTGYFASKGFMAV